MPAHGAIVGRVQGVNYVAVRTRFEVHCSVVHDVGKGALMTDGESDSTAALMSRTLYLPHAQRLHLQLLVVPAIAGG